LKKFLKKDSEPFVYVLQDISIERHNWATWHSSKRCLRSCQRQIYAFLRVLCSMSWMR